MTLASGASRASAAVRPAIATPWPPRPSSPPASLPPPSTTHASPPLTTCPPPKPPWPLCDSYDYDSTSIRRAFDACSTAYQRSLKLWWRNAGRWPANHSHADLSVFVYLGRSAASPCVACVGRRMVVARSNFSRIVVVTTSLRDEVGISSRVRLWELVISCGTAVWRDGGNRRTAFADQPRPITILDLRSFVTPTVASNIVCTWIPSGL